MSNETYADLASLKDWLGTYGPDVVIDVERDDYALGTALIAASRAIDNWTNRRFYLDAEASDYYAQAVTGQTVWFPDLSDASTMELAVDRDYSLEFATVLDASHIAVIKPHTAPYRSVTLRNIELLPTDVVRITGVYGWPAVPGSIEQATLLLAARYFKRRSSPEGVTGFEGEYGPIRVTQRDADVASLIAPYKIHGWA